MLVKSNTGQKDLSHVGYSGMNRHGYPTQPSMISFPKLSNLVILQRYCGACLPSTDGLGGVGYSLAWLRFNRCTLAFFITDVWTSSLWQSLAQYYGLSIGQTWCGCLNEKCPPVSGIWTLDGNFWSFRWCRLSAKSWALRLKALYHFQFAVVKLPVVMPWPLIPSGTINLSQKQQESNWNTWKQAGKWPSPQQTFMQGEMYSSYSNGIRTTPELNRFFSWFNYLCFLWTVIQASEASVKHFPKTSLTQTSPHIAPFVDRSFISFVGFNQDPKALYSLDPTT